MVRIGINILFAILFLTVFTFCSHKKGAVGEIENPIQDTVDNNTKGSLNTEDSLANAYKNLMLNDYTKWKIKNGKFYFDNKWVFLKVGKPLRDFANVSQVYQLIADLDRLKDKDYKVLEINCYWHHFDKDGDGVPDVSLAPLRDLINAIYEKGMIPCLSIETYGVGGGQIPASFWEKYPTADAVDNLGHKVADSEYGTGARVPSIFNKNYLEATRTFIKSLVSAIDFHKILYFETTVEPQYMGAINLDYSESAKEAYADWLDKNNISDRDAQMPDTFPIPQKFINNEYWNRFRAESLANWVNGDAAAFRDIAGKDAYIAVDYLDASEESMRNRDGNPEIFLDHLTSPNIIQVNWTWYFPKDKPNQKAYDRVYAAMKEMNRDWAVAEHMTFNGSDFTRYSDSHLKTILLNTLAQGTHFGWEFVSVSNSSKGNFALYEDDWSPKRVIGVVDNHWGEWLKTIKELEKQ